MFVLYFEYDEPHSVNIDIIDDAKDDKGETKDENYRNSHENFKWLISFYSPAHFFNLNGLGAH